MKWARRRIEEEVAANAELEKVLGSDELTDHPDKRKPRCSAPTANQKIALIKEVDKLRRLGMTTDSACSSLDLSASAYNNWRRKLNLGTFKK